MSRNSRLPPSCRVFIGNIDPSVTTEEIEHIFENYGKIMEPVRMHKGYTFVQYDNTESAERAIRENKGLMLGGKPIDAQLAKGGQAERQRASEQTLGKRKYEDDNYRDNYNRGADNYRPRSPQYSNAPPQKRFRDQQPPEPQYIPIYIVSTNMSNYAHYIKDTLAHSNLNGKVINLSKPSEQYFTSQQFFGTIATERFVLVIQQKNEQNRDVAFRAILPDGSSPGFADTPLIDVMQFVSNQPNPPTLPPVLPPQPISRQPISNVNPYGAPQPAPYTASPPTEALNDPQLNNMILQMLDKLKQPEYNQPPPQPYYGNPPPVSEDVTSLLNTIQNLGRKHA